VHFTKSPHPFRIVAEGLINQWMKVPVSAVLIATEDDCRGIAIGALVAKSACRRKPQAPQTEFTAQTDGTRFAAEVARILVHTSIL
jgi:hypothetical protein